MKLKVFDIPEAGMDIEAGSSEKPEDRWFLRLAEEAYQEDYPKGNKAALDIHLLRTGDNVQISGLVEIDLKPSCHRCMEMFERHVDVPLHVNLVPRRKIPFGGEEEEEDEGLDENDIAFSFYKGEEIDLSDIICEMLVLAVPFRYLCKESCKGLCARCGQNLNVASCQCGAAKGDSRFSVLKQLIKD